MPDETSPAPAAPAQPASPESPAAPADEPAAPAQPASPEAPAAATDEPAAPAPAAAEPSGGEPAAGDPSASEPAAPAEPASPGAPAADPTPAEDAGPARGTLYTLTFVNESTVPGEQYLNVFPPQMVVSPNQQQTVFAEVSPPTSNREPGQSTAVMKWYGGPEAIALIVAAPGEDQEELAGTPVTLGSAMAVAWVDGKFTVTQTSAGTTGPVTVAFTTDSPQGSQAGLRFGPGRVMVAAPTKPGTLTMTPVLAQTFEVRFGTRSQPGWTSITDYSQAATVEFTSASTTATMRVGPDNIIRQV